MSGILVGYDGSGHALRALEWAAREAVIRREPLTVLSVRQAAPVHWFHDQTVEPGPPGSLEQTGQQASEQAEKAISRASAELARPHVTVRAVSGSPAEELLSAASGADMVVVGSRGTGGFANLRLGSVSSYVTHNAHCPVVVIPDDGP